MHRFFVFFLFIATLSGPSLWASSRYHGVLTYNLGISSVSLTENESIIETTDDSVDAIDLEEPAAASISAMNFNISWEFAHDGNFAYVLSGFAPLMSSDGSGLFGSEIGFNMYLNDLGSKFTMMQNGSQMTIVPTFKYYWGAHLGGGYAVYNTESATKSDVYFNIGLHGGLNYAFGETWGLKTEVGFSRTTGVATTGTKIDIIIGATYYL